MPGRDIGTWGIPYKRTYTAQAVRGIQLRLGDEESEWRSRGTHDQIYPSAHDKMDFADQFGWRNIKDIRAGVDEKVAKQWTLTEMVDDLWLADKNDAVYASSGAISIAAHPGATSSHSRLGARSDRGIQAKPARNLRLRILPFVYRTVPE